ncbi:MAG: arsenate reductase family protein [Flavobacteriales bacterium]
MKKAFTLPTCKTCQRIFDDLRPAQHGCEVVDIKAAGISAADLDAMKAHAGSYEALFSRRAMKFRSMGLADKALTEQDYRKLILEEYTFLKRPVFLTDEGATAGSAKAEVARARDLIS